MHYVYILQSESDGELYVGCTNDIQRRVEEHNTKKVQSTKNRTPLHLIHYEAFLDKYDAFERECFLKTGWGKRFIRRNLKNFFHD
ncbi:excinuclease ABC subunit C [bacterium]|nr:excinuclease ABC subunit C [bacterium]